MSSGEELRAFSRAAVRPVPAPRDGAGIDIVADRHRLLLIGMVAVFVACVVFAPARLGMTLATGLATPWWVNVLGAVAVAALFLWYRRRPLERSSAAVHGTALVATVALVVPVFYGMTSTIWWLSLVGFAGVLLGRRREAWIWGVTIPITVVFVNLVEPAVKMAGAAGEPDLEQVLARSLFVFLLVGMAAAFRVVAEQRAAVFHASEERYRMLFERAPVGVFLCDRDLCVSECNESFERALGASPGSLAGVCLDSIADGRLRPALLAALAGGHGAYDGPCACVSGDCERFISVRTAPLHGLGGAVVSVIGTVVDVTERRRMEGELRQSSERLRLLSRRLVQVQEEERRAIALELHDEAGQTLTAISLQLAPLAKTTELDVGQRATAVQQIRSLLGDTMESLHALSARLRPVALDRLGLARALVQLGETARLAGLDVRCEVEGLEDGSLPREIEVTVYRAVQEAVNNAVKHAGATRLEVRVVRQGERLQLVVADNGAGFDVSAAVAGSRLGLSGMAERLELVGGSLQIESAPGAGTRVSGSVEL